MTFLRRCLPLAGYLRSQWRAVALILLLTFMSSMVAIFEPWPLKLIIDHALKNDPLPSRLGGLARVFGPERGAKEIILGSGVAMLLLALASLLITAALTWAWARIGTRMTYAIAGDVYRKLQSLSLTYHNRKSVGESLVTLTSDNWTVFDTSVGLFVKPIAHVSTLLGVGLLAWTLNPLVTLLLISVVPVLTLIAVISSGRLERLKRNAITINVQLTDLIRQTMRSIPLVQVFGTEKRNRALFDQLKKQLLQNARRSAMTGQTFGAMRGFTTTAMVALVIFVSGREVLAGALTIGGLLVLVRYVRTVQGSVNGLLNVYVGFRTAKPKLERLLDVMESGETIPENPGAPRLPVPRQRTGYSVTFDDVWFAYDSKRPTLRGLDFSAPAGATVAVVGASGSGKSTLAALIPRFFDPERGRVLINGKDVRNLNLSSVRDCVSVMTQNPLLLPVTVAQNIAFGKPGASLDEIVEAARRVGADGFIREMPDGYDTLLTRQDLGLSGGQMQLIALARALLKHAPILVLDEPTASVDAHTENLLLETLRDVAVDQTTFILAHRPSTVREADLWLAIDKGVVVNRLDEPPAWIERREQRVAGLDTR